MTELALFVIGVLMGIIIGLSIGVILIRQFIKVVAEWEKEYEETLNYPLTGSGSSMKGQHTAQQPSQKHFD